MGTVFTEMSSWKALTGFTVMKTAFKTRNMNSEFFGISIMKFVNLRVIEENVY